MGSWRVDDVAQMETILAKFNEAYPNIEIKFDPTNPPDYNATLQTHSRPAPPRTCCTCAPLPPRGLYDQGFLADISDLPGLQENFTPEAAVACLGRRKMA